MFATLGGDSFFDVKPTQAKGGGDEVLLILRPATRLELYLGQYKDGQRRQYSIIVSETVFVHIVNAQPISSEFSFK